MDIQLLISEFIPSVLVEKLFIDATCTLEISRNKEKLLNTLISRPKVALPHKNKETLE